MSYTDEQEQKFFILHSHIENQGPLKKKADGGNSILFSYPPSEEYLYIEKAKERFSNTATLIDISKLLVEYIDGDGWDAFQEYYLEFTTTPHIIFRSDDPSRDLFDLIIEQIIKTSESGQIPFLIRTGCLFGTGIENINIMEHKRVIGLPHPLVIFYPSTIEDNNLYFLNFKIARNYRCTLIR